VLVERSARREMVSGCCGCRSELNWGRMVWMVWVLVRVWRKTSSGILCIGIRISFLVGFVSSVVDAVMVLAPIRTSESAESAVA